MQRPIKFRGKRVDDGQWVYGGGVVTLPDGTCIMLHLDDKTIVQPKTVGQYIGLPDKNSVWIYEGDIVKFHQSMAVIVWEWGGFIAKIIEAGNPGDREGLNYPMTLDGCHPLPFEVIGNIHDNPELSEATNPKTASGRTSGLNKRWEVSY